MEYIVKLQLDHATIEWFFKNKHHRFIAPSIIRCISVKLFNGTMRKRWWNYGEFIAGEDEDGIYWTAEEKGYKLKE